MKNILVTGGAGFIGSNFVHYLAKKEPKAKIIILDALTYAGNLWNLKGLPFNSYTFVHGNICDPLIVMDILRRHKIDLIVNFAAESHVDRSIANPSPFILTNVVGTLNLLKCAHKLGNIRFHHISTDEVYGSLSEHATACSEDYLYNPSSPYSASKAASDHLVRAYYKTYRLPITITNCTNNYGPRQHVEKFIPLAITNAMKGEPIPIYGDGKNIRDWLYVEDHCEAIWTILERGYVGSTYNVAGRNQITNLDVAQKICSLIPSGTIQFVKDRPGHDFRYALSISKIRAFGWMPNHTFDEGLKKTVQWYINKKGGVS